MSRLSWFMVLAGCVACARGASADLIGASAVEHDAGFAEGVTYRIYLEFDNPAEQLLAVGGIPGLAALDYAGPSPLANDPWDGGSSAAEDFPGAGEAWDSWVTIGGPIPFGDTALTASMCGVIPECAPVIAGTSFHGDDGGWYDSDPSTLETGPFILIAQFSYFDDAPSGTATLSGVAVSLPVGSPDFVLTQFAVEWQVIPAPSAAALFALGSFMTSRSRRRASGAPS